MPRIQEFYIADFEIETSKGAILFSKYKEGIEKYHSRMVYPLLRKKRTYKGNIKDKHPKAGQLISDADLESGVKGSYFLESVKFRYKCNHTKDGVSYEEGAAYEGSLEDALNLKNQGIVDNLMVLRGKKRSKSDSGREKSIDCTWLPEEQSTGFERYPFFKQTLPFIIYQKTQCFY